MREINHVGASGIDRAIDQLRKAGAKIYDSDIFANRLMVVLKGGHRIENLGYLDLPRVAAEHAAPHATSR